MTADHPTSIKRTARLAGALYLIMGLFAFFGLLYVPSRLTVPGDAAATAGNIIAAEGLFRLGIVGHLVGQTLFIFLVLVLYRLLEPVNRRHAALMAVLALIGVPIAFLNEVNHLAVLRLLSGTGAAAALGSAQLQTQAMLLLELRGEGILVAQIFWGLWLLPLGWLVFRSGFLPRILGVLLIIGGAGYAIDVLSQVLLPRLGATVSQFTFVGEVAFPLWLLFKGVDVEAWERRAGIPRAPTAA